MRFTLKPVLAGLVLPLMIAAPVFVTATVYPVSVEAKTQKKSVLPKPYVSRALRAVLMPVTKTVAKKFKLAKGAKGVMVVSVQPDGLGKMAGLKPGDVISSILGRPVTKPVDVDTIIAYFLKNGINDYAVAGTRKNGRTYRAVTPTITYEYYWAPVDVYSVSTWTSFSYSSYSYTEYYSYYSESIVESYSYYSESVIEQTISESSYVSTMEASYSETARYDEEVVEGAYVSGGEGEVWSADEAEVAYTEADDPPEPAFKPEPGDTSFIAGSEEEAPAAETDSGEDEGYAPESADDDEAAAAGDEAVDEGAVDEGAADEGAVDEGAVDEGVVDEGAGDEATVDEGAVDEGSVDEGVVDEGAGDEATVDEGVVDEGVVDEGAGDEATFDEGAVDEGAGDEATFDEGTLDEGAVDEGAVDEGAVDDGSGGEGEVCNGEVVDGVCTDGSEGGDEGAYDAGGGEAEGDGGGEEEIIQ